MNTQEAREQANHVQRVAKGTEDAENYIARLASGRAFLHFDKASEVGKVLRKVIYMAEGQAGEFNVYLKNVI